MEKSKTPCGVLMGRFHCTVNSFETKANYCIAHNFFAFALQLLLDIKRGSYSCPGHEDVCGGVSLCSLLTSALHAGERSTLLHGCLTPWYPWNRRMGRSGYFGEKTKSVASLGVLTADHPVRNLVATPTKLRRLLCFCH